MELSGTVALIEQCRISAPSGLELPVSLPLTFFDIEWLVASPAVIFYFYEFHGSKENFLTNILPELKHSLSLSLQYAFPLAGTLTWPDNSTKPVILCSEGDSVTFTVAESNYDFYELSGNQPRDVNLFYPLIPEMRSTSDTDAFPVLALQVTLFPNKGICIGIQSDHAVADAKIIYHFIKSWSSVCRNGDTPFMNAESLLSYDRSLVKDPNGGDMSLLKLFNITKESIAIPKKQNFPIQDKVLAKFVIGPDDIKRMKQWISGRVENQRTDQKAPLHLSSFVVSCAYVWVCVVKLHRGEGVEDQCFGFSIDCRGRLKPRLPTLYFGNCVGGAMVKAKRSELIGDDGIMVAAMLIGNSIKKYDDGDIISAELKLLESWLEPNQGNVLRVSGSPNFRAYDTDFGWGRPTKFEIFSIVSTGAMSLSECPDKPGGLEIGLAGNKKEISAFSSIFAQNLQLYTARL